MNFLYASEVNSIQISSVQLQSTSIACYAPGSVLGCEKAD